jgi:hypothetical protein
MVNPMHLVRLSSAYLTASDTHVEEWPAQHSTAQHSAAQHSAAQHSAAQQAQAQKQVQERQPQVVQMPPAASKHHPAHR